MKQGNTNSSKENRELRELRVQKAVQCIIEGYTPQKVWDEYGEEWGVQQRTVYNYYKDAKEFIRSQQIDDILYYTNLNATRLNMLFGQAWAVGDYNASLGAIRTLNDMLGINKQNIEVTGGVNIDVNEASKKYQKYLKGD